MAHIWVTIKILCKITFLWTKYSDKIKLNSKPLKYTQFN